jgi:hypothetical protein
MKKKNILFVIWSFSLGGGAEKMLSVLSRNLDIDKYNIDILEIENHGYKEKIGPHTRVLPAYLNPSTDSKLLHNIKWYIFKLFPRLIKRLKTKNKKYDFEIAFNYLYPVFCVNKNAKTISWNHGSIYNLNFEDNKRERLRKNLEYINKIVAISEKTKDSIINVYPEYEYKLNLINNGYDFNEIISASNQDIPHKIEDDNLIFLGRIEKAKGIPRLLNIFKEVVKILPDKKLYLLGTGELDKYTLDYIEKNNLTSNIVPLGYIKNPYPYINKSAYVIMLSEAEGFPTVFVEGLSLGVGFISTNVGGVKELSNNSLCGFISDNDKELIDYIIAELSKKKNDRIIKSDTCQNHVNKYSITEQINKFEKLLDEL